MLGCCLLSSALALMPALERLGADGLAFYDLRHRVLWQTLATMATATPPVIPDTLSLVQFLRARSQLEAVGGAVYVDALSGLVPSAANLGYYLEELCDFHLKRRLLAAAIATAAQIREGGDASGTQMLTEHTAQVLSLEGGLARPGNTVDQSLERVLTRLEDIKHGRKMMLGPGTGFNYLDNILCGLKAEEYIVIAGRPGGGKTMLAMQIAEHWATVHRLPVGIFSLEMSQDALIERMVFSLGRAQMQKYRNGFFVNADMPGILGAVEILKEAAAKGLLNIDDTPGLNIEQLSLRMRRWHREKGCRLFIVDYIQLLRGHQRRRYTETNRAGELADISIEINLLKKDLKVPIILLAQMNRNIESSGRNKDGMPVLSDLKDCGQIEQDADAVLFLYDPNLQKVIADPDHKEADGALRFLNSKALAEVPPEWRSRAEDTEEGPWHQHLKRQNVLVAKQRNGPSDVSAALVRVNQWMRYLDAYTPARAPAPKLPLPAREPEPKITGEDMWGEKA